MRETPTRRAALPSPYRRIVFSISEDFSCGPLNGAVNNTSIVAWLSANDPVAMPFVVRTPGIVTALGWLNGSAAGEGVDMGIYDRSWNRLVSVGAHTAAGDGVWEFVDVADTALPVGRYYAVMVRDNVTAARQVVCASGTSSIPFMAFMGCQDSATDAYPLPDPLTNMAPCTIFSRYPLCGVAFRTPYA